MSLIVAIILGFVQGATEFLPVSSSGHLSLLNKICGVGGDFLFITILLHLATLLAVVVVFRKDIWHMITHPFSPETKKLVLATIPTILLVFCFKGFLENSFESTKILPYCFLVTALLLFFTYLISSKEKVADFDRPLKNTSAIVMGIAQGLATLPGISRSGSTICAGLLCGENRENSAKFSFLMSIPIILASMFYEVLFGNMSTTFSNDMIFPLISSFLVAFIVGIFSIKFMLNIIKNAKYYYFSIYLIAVSVLAFFVV